MRTKDEIVGIAVMFLIFAIGVGYLAYAAAS